MSNSSSLPTIAFIGATGGVANAVLVHALRNSRKCIALARTPAKLRDLLLTQKVSEETLDALLTIVKGDALDKEAIKQVLTANGKSNFVVSSIINGLGATPSLRWNWSNPLNMVALDIPDICEAAAKNTLDALHEIYTANPKLKDGFKPDLAFVSTTGVSTPRGPEDVPFSMRFLYHQILATPHEDKRKTETLYRDNMEGKDTARGVLFKSVVGVRPTLLTGEANADSGVGLEQVRSGTEQAPAMGYTVRRADVGHWIWQELVADQKRRQSWGNEMVTLTY